MSLVVDMKVSMHHIIILAEDYKIVRDIYL